MANLCGQPVRQHDRACLNRIIACPNRISPTAPRLAAACCADEHCTTVQEGTTSPLRPWKKWVQQEEEEEEEEEGRRRRGWEEGGMRASPRPGLQTCEPRPGQIPPRAACKTDVARDPKKRFHWLGVRPSQV